MTCDQVCESLLDFVEGELTGAPRAAVEEHLGQCESCASRARETRQLVGDLGAAESIERRALKGGASAITQVSPAPATLRIEKLSLLGDYEIIDELGRGGMGVVYRARQVTLNRIVALKVLSVGVADSERGVERFLKEAQAAARLHHTNIVPIYGQGHERGLFYYAMELVEGDSLDKLIRAQNELMQQLAVSNRSRSWVTSAIHTLTQRMPAGGGAHDFKRIARQIAEVAEALQHAHDQGIVHRDIKPQNLLLGRDDKLHITDFGLARILAEPGLTRSAEMVGTPAYMAPEQIQDGRHVDARADIYALGVTLYELLTLQRPFQAETYQQMIHHVLKREPRAPRKIDAHVPIDLETICLRAIEKTPAARFATAADMARELRRYGDDYPIVSRPVGPIGKAARWVKRNPARASALASAVLLAVAAPVAYYALDALADSRIDRAFYTLAYEDYSARERATSEIGWAAHFPVDHAHQYRLLSARALLQLREKDIDFASAISAIKLDPDSPDGHYLLAWLHARAKLADGYNDAMEAARKCEGNGRTLTPVGWFYRGQAIFWFDPRSAEAAFEEAINLNASASGRPFPQAAVFQAKAMSQIMYVSRQADHYQKTISRLEGAFVFLPGKAYPRYLLSCAHKVAGEIYRATGRRWPPSEDPFELALKAADDARRTEPTEPLGYVAAAQCLVVQRQFQGAVDMLEKMDHVAPVRDNASLLRDRYKYAMPAYFALRRVADAERMFVLLCQPETKYRPSVGERAFLAALFAADRGGPEAARGILDDAAKNDALDEDSQLLLEAITRLIDPTLSPGQSRSLSDNAQWLLRFLRGETDWQTLERELGQPPDAEQERNQREAREYLVRGIRELVRGSRDTAREALALAGFANDGEYFCFLAKMLLYRVEQDATWPPWLKTAASTTSHR